MKAMILAAGQGKRLRPLTETTPKALLKVGGQPLIAYHLTALAQCNITDVVINLTYGVEQTKALFGNGETFGFHIHYSIEESPGLETGGGIFNALSILGDEPFIVLSSDIWTDYPLTQLPKNLTHLAHLVLVPNPDFNPLGDFALQDDNLLSLTQEPRYNFSGISVLHPQLFDNCTPGRFSVVPLLQKAIINKQVSGELYTGLWRNINTRQHLTELDHLLTTTD